MGIHRIRQEKKHRSTYRKIMKIRIEPLVFVLLIVCLFEVKCQPAKKKPPALSCTSTQHTLRTLFNQVILKAGHYTTLLNNKDVKNLNQQAKVCFFSQYETEQDHMPPQSAVIAARKSSNTALAQALFGTGPSNMLAMSYKKGDHRLAGTTGSGKGVRAVTKLIQEAIENNDPVLTYKYSILATNTAECVTTAKRDFTNYMNAYINRLNGGNWPIGWDTDITKWTTKLKKNNLNNDPDYDKLVDAFEKADNTKDLTKLIC